MENEADGSGGVEEEEMTWPRSPAEEQIGVGAERRRDEAGGRRVEKGGGVLR